MASVGYLLGLVLLNPYVFACAKCTEERMHNQMSEIVQKLCGLGELNPRKCLSEAESLKVIIPKTPSETNRTLEMKTLFRFASELFQKNSNAARWKRQELQHLQDLLGQQSQCFQAAAAAAAGGGGEEVEKWRTFWTTLDQFLEEKDFSECAWESVRHVILTVMRRMCVSTKSRRQPRHIKCKCKR